MRRRSVLQLGLGAVALGFGSLRAAEAPEPAISRIVLSDDDPRFGGFSALHLAANGRDCLAMSDRGLFAALELARDAAGRLTGARVLSLTQMIDFRGKPLRRRNYDSEGLAMAGDGGLYVSFEGVEGGRIWRYATPEARPEAVPFSPLFADLPRNGGLEALAMDPQGRLLAMPEEPPGPDLPLYRLEAAGWRVIGRVPKSEDFKPVSLDAGPDGALYLLERAFRFPTFRSRLSRLDLAADLRRETLWQSRHGQFGNLEGLSVTANPAGGLRATMIADNNQLFFLSNEMIELDLP